MFASGPGSEPAAGNAGAPEPAAGVWAASCSGYTPPNETGSMRSPTSGDCLAGRSSTVRAPARGRELTIILKEPGNPGIQGFPAVWGDRPAGSPFHARRIRASRETVPCRAAAGAAGRASRARRECMPVGERGRARTNTRRARQAAASAGQPPQRAGTIARIEKTRRRRSASAFSFCCAAPRGRTALKAPCPLWKGRRRLPAARASGLLFELVGADDV